MWGEHGLEAWSVTALIAAVVFIGGPNVTPVVLAYRAWCAINGCQ